MALLITKRKTLLFVLTVIMLSFTCQGWAMATEENAAGTHFSLDSYALRGTQDAGAKLFLSIQSTESRFAAPEQLKHVLAEVTTPDGTGMRAENFSNVASPEGRAIVDLGDVPLNAVLNVQVFVQTGRTVKTEVLHSTTAVTEFAVNNKQTVTADFEGFGAQMNSDLYTGLNDPSRNYTGNEAPKDVENAEAKIVALKPGLSRIFLSPKIFDPADPNRQNMADSFYKTVALAQKAGANVNISWWYLESDWNDPDHFDALIQKDMHEFADTLVDLIQNKGFTAVKEITIQNEPNRSKFNQDDNITIYASAYRYLDQYLKDAGIRDQIKFIGGDLVVNNQAYWFNYLADNMWNVLDGWSVHIYWNYFQTGYMQDRLSGIKAIYDSILPDKRKPLEITEYGVRGFKSYAPKQSIKDFDYYRRNGNNYMTNTLAGYYQEGNDTPYYQADNPAPMVPVNQTNIAAFEQAWFNMQALNDGFAGLSKWDMYRAQYDFTYQDHSLIGYLFDKDPNRDYPDRPDDYMAPGKDRWPLRPAYYMEWLMSNTSGQGWKVVGYNGTSGQKLITALQSADGSNTTIFAMNTDGSASSVSIGHLPVGKTYTVLIWNADGSGKNSKADSLSSGTTGTVTVDAPAGSMVALTTFDTGPLP
jgi:hypothetical protein